MVLREVLVAVRVHDRLARVAPRERLRAVLAVHVVVRPAVRREVRRLDGGNLSVSTGPQGRKEPKKQETRAQTETHLVDERARLRVRPRRRRVPERAARVHGARLPRVDHRERARVRACSAIVREARVVVRSNAREVRLHEGVVRGGIRAEPRLVARCGRGRRVLLEIRECGRRVRVGVCGGRLQRGPLGGRAAGEPGALGEGGGMSDRELATGQGDHVWLGIRAERRDLVIGVHEVEEA